MSGTNEDVNQPESRDLGAKVGQLYSSPESLQKVLVGVSVVSGIGCAVLLSSPFVLLIFAFMFLAFTLDFVLRRVGPFSTKLSVHERGLQIRKNGRTQEILYSDVEELLVDEEDHHSRVKGVDVYVGTRVKIDMVLEGCLRSTSVDMECHRKRKSWKTIDAAISRLDEAVQLRLSQRLEAGESIALAPTVELTIDGIECHGKLTGFEEIGHFRRMNNEIQVYRLNDALPFASFESRRPNFIPAYSLMRRMREAVAGSVAAQDAETGASVPMIPELGGAAMNPGASQSTWS